jgi:hypothetical protein
LLRFRVFAHERSREDSAELLLLKALIILYKIKTPAEKFVVYTNFSGVILFEKALINQGRYLSGNFN